MLEYMIFKLKINVYEKRKVRRMIGKDLNFEVILWIGRIFLILI